MDRFPLSDVTVYTHMSVHTWHRSLSAYQSSCFWKRKLVLLHMDKFPLSDVTVHVHVCAHVPVEF